MQEEKYYKLIKDEIIKYEAGNVVRNYIGNKKQLETYYNIGKMLVEAQGGEVKAKYGNKIIKNYSEKLTKEFGSGYSQRNLKYMRLYYVSKIGQACLPNLNWTQICVLLSVKNEEEINYYANVCSKENLSYRKLEERIKSKEYYRLSESTREKLKGEVLGLPEVTDNLKDPIIINNVKDKDISKITHRLIEELIINDLENFMRELGGGYTFVGREYKLNYFNENIYVDILLFNIIFNCYVVIEIKTDTFKEEYKGQVERYINAVDFCLKSSSQNKTIGIIMCKEANSLKVRYVTDERIKIVRYEIK